MRGQPATDEPAGDRPAPSRVRVATRHGPAELIGSAAQLPWATLVLGHGAGGGTGTRDLGWLAAGLPASGVTVIRVEAPWRVAGRRVAPRPAVLDEGWLEMLARLTLHAPLVVGGRSAGARVACRTATSVGAAACLALAFPLHPPGRPGASRLPELQDSGVPTLVVQGERDPFGRAADFPPFPGLPRSTRVVPIAEADHSFGVRRTSGRTDAHTRADLVGTVLTWLRDTVRAP